MYTPTRYTATNMRRHNHGLSGAPSLGFSFPAWLTGTAKSVVMTAAEAAEKALKSNTNVTIAGRTFNLGNKGDVAALRAIAAGITSGKGASPVSVSFTDKPLPPTIADLVTNPVVLGIGGLLALKFLFRG